MNVPFTIQGSDLDLITGVSFFLNGNPDPGIIVSSFQVDPSGTQATFVVSITGTAVPSGHFINLNSTGFQYFGGNFTVVPAGAPAVYSITPDRGDLGSRVRLAITGSGLADVTSISFALGSTGGPDSAIGLQNLSVSENLITADVIIDRTGVIGPHPVRLKTANNPIVLTGAIFSVQTDGLLISSPASVDVTQGAGPKTVTFNGTGLDAVTGFDFITPSGDIDSGVRVSAFTAQSGSITATLAADANALIGSRSIVLRARGTGFITTVKVMVATPSGVAPVGSLGTLSPGGTAKISLFRNSAWNITGIKFQRNGVDDDSIVVTDFQTTSNSVSATVSISGNADLGPRTIALIIDGISVPTTISVSVTPGGQGGPGGVLITSSSPTGATAGQGSVPLTIKGPNLSGIKKIEFATSAGVDTGITVSDISVSDDGRQIDATLTISSTAAIGFHQIQAGSGSQTFLPTGGSVGGVMIYAAGATALYSISPDTGEVGQSIAGFKVTGAGLTDLTADLHSPLITQNYLVLQNAVATTNSIQGTLSIGRDAFIGQWSVGLRNRNPLRQSPTVYSAPFNVTQNGVSVRTLSLSRLRRGDSGVAFTITGDNLGAVSGVEILNPDGSKDTGIVASDVVAKDTSIQGNLTADSGVPIGPRFIILDFSDGTSVKTLLNFVVQTPEGLFMTFPNVVSVPPNSKGVPLTIQESVPWGITGIKFLRNGTSDSSIKVSGFTSSDGTTRVKLDIARDAPLGIRNIVLIGPDGSDIPTSAIFAVVPFTQ